MTNGVKKPPLCANTERFLAKGRGEVPSLDFTGDYAVEWATSIHNRDAALKKYGKDREEAQRLARDKRQARPNETITAIADEIHSAFEGEGRLFPYRTIYQWVSEVAPPAVRRPGRPPKK
jgi:hypothetical protein